MKATELIEHLRSSPHDVFLWGAAGRACIEGRQIRGTVSVGSFGRRPGDHFLGELKEWLEARGCRLRFNYFETRRSFDGAAFWAFQRLRIEFSGTEKQKDIKYLDTDQTSGVVDVRSQTPEDGLEFCLRVAEVGLLKAKTDAFGEDKALTQMLGDPHLVLSAGTDTCFECLDQILLSPFPDLGLRALEKWGALEILLPELWHLKNFHRSSKFHHKDVYTHTLTVIRQTIPKSSVRWAALLHDVGKRHTRTYTNDGRVHFFRHDEVGAYLTQGVLRRLNAPEDFIEHVAKLVNLHLRPGLYTPEWSDSAIRRLKNSAGDAFDDLIALARADNTTKRMEKRLKNLRTLKSLSVRADRLSRVSMIEAPQLPRALGRAIIEQFNLEPSPKIGLLRQHCVDGVQKGLLTEEPSIEQCIDYLRHSPIH